MRSRKDQIHGVIGPNGSGKTTLFNCISGHLRPESGSIQLAGRALTGLAPHAIANLGVRRTFQAGKLVNSLTVLENVMAGVYEFRGKRLLGYLLPSAGKALPPGAGHRAAGARKPGRGGTGK